MLYEVFYSARDLQRLVKHMDHDESCRLCNHASLYWACNALQCISEAMLPNLGDVLLSTAGHCKPSRILFILHAAVYRILLASTGGRAFASMYCLNLHLHVGRN